MDLMVDVLNSGDTASLALEAILNAGSYDLGPKSSRIENPADWTREMIAERVKSLSCDKGPAGNFED